MGTIPMVEWVHEWFYAPGVLRTPDKDRLYCFETVVVEIRKMIFKADNREDRRFIFDLLTYCLLGFNPVTSWPNASIFEPPDVVVDDDTKSIIRRLLNFESSEVNKSSAYALISKMIRVGYENNNKSTPLYYGEHNTNIILALWLLDTHTTTPKQDIGLLRACLDLYYTSESSEYKTLDEEYASTKLAPNYNLWIANQINRLLKRNISNDELFASVAYLGWFASLVRTKRLTAIPSRTSTSADDVNAILMNEIDQIKKTLFSSDMVSESEPVRDGPCLWCAAQLFRLLRGPRNWISRFGNKTETKRVGTNVATENETESTNKS